MLRNPESTIQINHLFFGLRLNRSPDFVLSVQKLRMKPKTSRRRSEEKTFSLFKGLKKTKTPRNIKQTPKKVPSVTECLHILEGLLHTLCIRAYLLLYYVTDNQPVLPSNNMVHCPRLSLAHSPSIRLSFFHLFYLRSFNQPVKPRAKPLRHVFLV